MQTLPEGQRSQEQVKGEIDSQNEVKIQSNNPEGQAQQASQ